MNFAAIASPSCLICAVLRQEFWRGLYRSTREDARQKDDGILIALALCTTDILGGYSSGRTLNGACSSRLPSASRLRRFAFRSMIARSRSSRSLRFISRRWSRKTVSMNAERDCFDPATRSIPFKTSRESMTDVFSFIRPHKPEATS